MFDALRSRVPRIEKVLAGDAGRPLLAIKDAPFENPVLARFASDALKMLAYLVLLYDPDRHRS
ncbi:MAG: hypothetical protein U1E35_07855 [Rhodospirillales bacterium]